MSDLFSLHNVWVALNPDESVSKVIIWLMWLIFLVYTTYLVIYYFKTAKKRVSRIINKVKEIGGESEISAEEHSLYSDKERMKEHFAQSPDAILKRSWLSFDQSLISNNANTRLFSTVDNRYFFNATALAPWLSGNRLIVSVPSMLVAIGVLGTFLGLVIGLSGLDANASDTETLRAGIGTLISGASVAFTTSIWGVFLSLLAGFIERAFERAIKANISQINHALAALFPSISSEQALIHIEDASEQSKVALQTLHEKIGAELEKSVQNLSVQMQEALVSALEGIMKPAIDSLVENSQQQSSEALESLVGQFMSGMNQAGQAQTREMGHAAERLDGSLDKLSQITKASSEQNQQMIAQHRELTQHFEQAVDGMRTSSKYLAASSTQLGGVSRDLLSVSRELGKGIAVGQIKSSSHKESEVNPYA